MIFGVEALDHTGNSGESVVCINVGIHGHGIGSEKTGPWLEPGATVLEAVEECLGARDVGRLGSGNRLETFVKPLS